MTSNHPRRRHRTRPFLTAASLMAVLAIVLGACTQALPAVTPTPTPSPTPTAAPTASPTPSSIPTVEPTASPTAEPTPTPTVEPTPCPVTPQTGTLPSDRLVNVTASSGGGADTLAFVFGKSSIGSPAGTPTGELSLAEPPYTYGASGLPITMVGDRVLLVVFRHMSLQSDTGDPVYTGPADLSPNLAVLRHAVEYDESEGVIGWYVGFDGPHCPTLALAGNQVTLSFPSP
jgi:hypothetical protein